MRAIKFEFEVRMTDDASRARAGQKAGRRRGRGTQNGMGQVTGFNCFGRALASYPTPNPSSRQITNHGGAFASHPADKAGFEPSRHGAGGTLESGLYTLHWTDTSIRCSPSRGNWSDALALPSNARAGQVH
ncbi:hypothetical protein JMJ77_0015168 [Colletotrichum scovillei]|uniref:Uncharacterized protein n=1 Tax=Colletotrichum scovillei TaxID=1209932 RepID=A0A9P7R328_9PEZI|nr:hypothetical protein JMJ77_0015168 [Colletotrichum scovillei]KAG7056794.1 hypothetical protein JMJ78_0000584 [Colletotrichum scovillei]KAG7066718.1 hypothetical protein JMJ76_0000570 [Colletotrichum scovillei]